jgi:hypothetical protein
MEGTKMKLRMYRDNLEKIIYHHLLVNFDLPWWDVDNLVIEEMIEDWKKQLNAKGITLVIIEEE